MLPFQQCRASFHAGGVGPLTETHRVPFHQRMFPSREVHAIAVSFFLCRAAGVEFFGYGGAFEHAHVLRKACVERVGDLFGRDLYIFVKGKIAYLPRRMHARVRPSAARNAHGERKGPREGAFQFVLYRPAVFLYLPAGKIRPVIADEKRNVHNFVPEMRATYAAFYDLTQKICQNFEFAAQINIQEHDARDERRHDQKPHEIAPGKPEFFVLRSALRPAVTARVHRVAEVFRPAESGYEQRDQDGHDRFRAGDQPARFEVRAPRLLRRDDAVGLVHQRGDEAERDAHDEREFVHGESDPFKGGQKAFDAVRQRDGRRREGQDRRAHDEQEQSEREEDHIDDRLVRDRDDPPVDEGFVRTFPRVKEQIEYRGENDEEEDHLHRAQHPAEGHARKDDRQNEEQDDRREPEKVFRYKDRDDKGDHQDDLRAGVHVVHEGFCGIVLPESDVIEHLPRLLLRPMRDHPLLRRTSPPFWKRRRPNGRTVPALWR